MFITALIAANVLLAVSLFTPEAQTPVQAASSALLSEGRDCCKTDAGSMEPYCCNSCCWTKKSCASCEN
jgi:hypothetical protein